MTPAEVIEAARNRLNALTDTLWSENELLQEIFLCEQELAQKANCIAATNSSTVSVASQSDYTIPTAALEVWRVEYDGVKLQKIDRRENDRLNFNQSTQLSGTPIYWIDNGTTVTLVPTPTDAADVIKFYYHSQPTEAAITGTLTTPAMYHHVLVDGLTYKMCPKDLGHPLTLFWEKRWMQGIAWTEQHIKRRKRGDRFAVVKREEDQLTTEIGLI